MNRVQVIVGCALWLTIIVVPTYAETLAVRLKGSYPAGTAWIAAIANGHELELLPASILSDTSGTIITAEREGIATGDASAVLVTEDGSVISSMLEDTSAVTMEGQSRTDELLLLRSRTELLSKTRDDLAAAIKIEQEKIEPISTLTLRAAP